MTTEERLKILREAKPNSWVAFSADGSKFVAEATTYSAVLRIARENGEQQPVLFRTSDNWRPPVVDSFS